MIDEEVLQRLRSAGAVVLEGPKACGKTATGRRFANSEVLLDVDANARRAAALHPDLVLDGTTPRLIDEWQVEPGLWNHVRRAVDDRTAAGQFILTGSSVPADDITRHTGAGRVARLRMRPFSLFESGHSSGEISVRQLLDGEPSRAADRGLDVPAIAELVSVGGWPGFFGRDLEARLQGVRDYLEEIRRVDVRRVDGTDFDPVRVGRVLRSLARNVATYTPTATLASDAGGSDGPLHRDTVRRYLTALERLLILEGQPPWAPHLRSRSILRKAEKRHFVDPSLAVAALRATPRRLLDDLEYLGLLFESLAVRDLRIYAQPLGGRLLQYHDNTELEVDAIVELDDGRWGAFEVKLGAGQTDAAAATLHRFASRVDTARSGEPAVLGVIVSTGYGYVRDDGIHVIPIGALGP